MNTNKLLVAAFLATSIGAPISGLAGDTKVPQPIISTEIRVPFLHGLLFGQSGSRVSQAFAPILSANGGGAIVNVLSDAAWFARPMLTAYSATKSAAWGFTNALRIELREYGTSVLALHVGFMDTDLTKGLQIEKSDPRLVAACALEALEAGKEEVLADEQSSVVKRSLSTEQAYYLKPPDLA